MRGIIRGLVIIVFSFTAAQGQNAEMSNISMFVAASLGNFNVKMPETMPISEIVGESIGWDDIYESENGISYGLEAGIGLKDKNIFGVFAYRIWNKTGDPKIFGDIQFKGDLEWSQNFYSVGARYFLINLESRGENVFPYVGFGLIISSATEVMKGEASIADYSEYVDIDGTLDGTGFYVEGGADIFVNTGITLRGKVEYSSINLGDSNEGIRFEIEGGGGMFIGLSLNAFLK